MSLNAKLVITDAQRSIGDILNNIRVSGPMISVAELEQALKDL